MNTNNSRARRLAHRAGVGAAAAIAIGLMSTGAAHADTFVPLPDGQKAGPGAVITRTEESALISPSLAANGAGRTAWVSGTVTADVTGAPDDGEAGPSNGATNGKGTNNSSTHGVSRISTGYIVGCQVDITGLGGSIGAGIDLSGPSISGSLTVPVSAGQVKFVNVAGKDIKKNGKYAVQYQDTQLEIQNCGGFAQARSYTVVEIVGNDYSKTTLYGQPFSIG
ncbi:MspA protein [Rhodococcus sp. OK611]|uniref:MspA family porin n=1 Tax=unclassified Rhodococcus (in: high G+C Gram-positive bacteria) TaxID=192944 RepID=UPI000BC95BD2|nr:MULTISPECIES: MspA family porin [unclassified Rhodococcus (in: high G+C Gram-positive bacteria)]PTR44785.1 MspA protein [Rhodococcus sp. OK611]SNX90226.1 MspA protein [Rhodococcus sp. OK270]